jgi:hypothetical protein
MLYAFFRRAQLVGAVTFCGAGSSSIHANETTPFACCRAPDAAHSLLSLSRYLMEESSLDPPLLYLGLHLFSVQKVTVGAAIFRNPLSIGIFRLPFRAPESRTATWLLAGGSSRF